MTAPMTARHIGVVAGHEPAGMEAQLPVAASQSRLFAPVVAAIVLLSALLRLWRINLAEFKGDELAVTRLALALAQHGRWPAEGIPSSLGTNNSPLFVYVEALPALLWPSPLALTLFVAALNVIGVGMSILLARRYFGSVTALIGGLAFATGPWAVMYARKIWEQDLLPPVVLLFFFGLFAVIIERKPRRLVLCGAAASIAMQLHPSAIALPIIGLIALALWPRRFPWQAVLGALIAGGLFTLPYLIAEWRIGFADWRFALSNGAGEHLDRLLGLAVAWINWFQAATGWQVFGLLSPDGGPVTSPPFATVDFGIAALALLAAVVHLLGRLRVLLRDRQTSDSASAVLLLALWLFVPPLLLGLSGLLTFPHYFIVSYPAPFLALGVLAEALWRQGKTARTGVAVSLVALLAANLTTVGVLLRTVDRAPFPNAYGLPLAFSAQAARDIAAAAHGQPYSLSVDPAFVDGEAVIGQMAAWDGAAPATTQAAIHVRVSLAASPPPAGAALVAMIEAPDAAPAARIWLRNAAGAAGQ